MSEHGPDWNGDGDWGNDDWGDDDSEGGDVRNEGESMREALVAIVPVATFGLGVSSAVFGFGELTAPIFVVGWFVLTPLIAILSDTTAARRLFGDLPTDDAAAVDENEAALEELKRRYARGEIDEAEFERRTATLLENESVDDVRERVDRSGGDPGERVDRSGGDPGERDDDEVRQVPRDPTGDVDDCDETSKRDVQREREYET